MVAMKIRRIVGWTILGGVSLSPLIVAGLLTGQWLVALASYAIVMSIVGLTCVGAWLVS